MSCWRRELNPDLVTAKSNDHHTTAVHWGSQQVQVVPSFVRHCKKTFHQNRLFWGLGIGYF